MCAYIHVKIDALETLDKFDTVNSFCFSPYSIEFYFFFCFFPRRQCKILHPAKFNSLSRTVDS